MPSAPKPKVDFGGAVLLLGDRAYAPGPDGTVLTCTAAHWVQDGTDTLHLGPAVALDPKACGPRQMAMLTMIQQALELGETSLL